MLLLLLLEKRGVPKGISHLAVVSQVRPEDNLLRVQIDLVNGPPEGSAEGHDAELGLAAGKSPLEKPDVLQARPRKPLELPVVNVAGSHVDRGIFRGAGGIGFGHTQNPGTKPDAENDHGNDDDYKSG